MDMIHALGLLHEYETPKQYGVRDFLHIVKATHVAARIVACELYHIPSWSSCYHEFLLVHTSEGFMLTVERVPTNNRVQVISSSGGVARDTITVMQAREHHEYWQSASQGPVCKGTLRWRQSSPQLLDIAFIASAASTIFKHYNLYVRQCYWYARITLDAMAGAFPSCSRVGTTSFSRRWFSMFGSYKQSQVQLLIDLHTIGCGDLLPLSVRTERHATRLVTPDIPHSLAPFTASSLAWLIFLQKEHPNPDQTGIWSHVRWMLVVMAHERQPVVTIPTVSYSVLNSVGALTAMTLCTTLSCGLDTWSDLLVLVPITAFKAELPPLYRPLSLRVLHVPYIQLLRAPRGIRHLVSKTLTLLQSLSQ
ncbi:hypothetical protein EDC04DRAFT_3088736 [Pisolithus marmoratus]|nr:hypothetical protein EDC04DRAFT_3088736 [Pisolithus marmoratus]